MARSTPLQVHPEPLYHWASVKSRGLHVKQLFCGVCFRFLGFCLFFGGEVWFSGLLFILFFNLKGGVFVCMLFIPTKRLFTTIRVAVSEIFLIGLELLVAQG